MDSAESFLLLDRDVLISVPWANMQGSDEVWIRMLSDRPLPAIDGVVRSKVINQKIVDVISFDEGRFEEKAMLVLENGGVITEVVTAMNGTGTAGFWCFDSITEMEKEAGTSYRRLIESI
jgi:hypothetical protein